MNRPFFSICIAAYNAQRYIDECLRSIAAQDCCDYEVIVVDDGSIEPLILSDTIVRALSSCHVKRIVNSGPYAARQVAFSLAVGEVILCIDADDKLCCASTLSIIKTAFLKNNVDIVIFNATSNEQMPTGIFDYSALGSGGAVKPLTVWRLFVKDYSLNSLCCKAFRRKLYIKSAKQRPRLLMAEDRLQCLEIMPEATSFWLIDEPLYFYRPNPASTTNAGYDPKYYRQTCFVEEEVLSFMAERDMNFVGWANYFLEMTSRVLLGIRYNSSLNWFARRAAYDSILSEKVFNIAFELSRKGSIHGTAGLRLTLLKHRLLGILDFYMLPWKIGSVLKHTVNNSRRFVPCKIH